jgi:hypothetical protein
MSEVCQQYLLRHLNEYRLDNLPATLFALINSAQYTTARYFSQDPLLFTRDEVIDAMAQMVESFCLPRESREKGTDSYLSQARRIRVC